MAKYRWPNQTTRTAGRTKDEQQVGEDRASIGHAGNAVLDLGTLGQRNDGQDELDNVSKRRIYDCKQPHCHLVACYISHFAA